MLKRTKEKFKKDYIMIDKSKVGRKPGRRFPKKITVTMSAETYNGVLGYAVKGKIKKSTAVRNVLNKFFNIK